MIIRKPICFLKQTLNKIYLHVNSYKYGHTTLVYYKKDVPAKTYELPITSSKLIINNLAEEGYYRFYTIDDNKKENKSNEVEIYFLQETLDTSILRILDSAPKDLPSTDTIDFIKERLHKDLLNDDSQNISALIYSYLSATEDIQPEEEETYYKELSTAQRYENSQNILWNKSISENFTIDYSGTGSISCEGLISSVVIYKDGTFYKKLYTEGLDEIDLALNKQGAYSLYLYEEDDLINKLSFIQYNDDIKTIGWQEQMDQTNMEDLFNEFKFDNIAYTDIDFTDEEKLYLSEEIKKNPTNYIVARPQIEDVGDNQIEITIPEYKLLKALGRTFYIGAKEQDLLFADYFDNYDVINNEKIIFNCNEHFLNGQMIFFVEDQSKNIVSNLTRYDFDNSFEDYYQKVRQAQISIYTKRLLPLIENKLPEYKSTVTQYLDIISRDTEYFSYENTWQTLIEMMLKYGNQINKNKLIPLILQDYNNSFARLDNFYSEPIIYYRSTDTLVYPAREDRYAVVVLSVDRGSSELQAEYYSPTKSALDFQVREKSYYIIYAIDSKTYKRSGITFISNVRNEETMVNYNVRLEMK